MKLIAVTVLLLFLSCKGEKQTRQEVISQENDGLFVTVDYDGLEAYLKTSEAEVHVVNFWATWCKPCVKELPYFEQVGALYEEEGVKVILVSLDFPEQLDHLRNFIRKKEISSEVVFLDDADANRWIPLVDDSWSGAIPATIMYNSNKRNFFEGSYTYDQLETEIKTFL